MKDCSMDAMKIACTALVPPLLQYVRCPCLVTASIRRYCHTGKCSREQPDGRVYGAMQMGNYVCSITAGPTLTLIHGYATSLIGSPSMHDRPLYNVIIRSIYTIVNGWIVLRWEITLPQEQSPQTPSQVPHDTTLSYIIVSIQVL